ncbi:MAG: RT0821/Lpp0805 family surface protein [Nitrospinota bacterium]
MKKGFCKAVVAVVAIGLLAGCAQTGISKRTGGAILGGIAGGVIGSQIGSGRGQILAAIGGTLLGALIGSEIGKRLDQRDRRLMAQATQDALERSPSGKATTWKNPDTGNSGTVVAKPAVEKAGGGVCREFTQTITVEGKTETAKGTACRQPDGTWKIVK